MEDGPLGAADETLLFAVCARLLVHLGIQPLDDLLHACKPLIPVAPDKWTVFALGVQQLDTVVELTHALSDVTAGVWVAHLRWRQWSSIEELFETTVLEGTQHARTNVLAGQTTKDEKFSFAVDQVLDLRAIDT